MTGSLPNLGPSAISPGATPYDYWLQQPPRDGQPNNLSWSPFSGTVRLQTVVNPVTGNSVQVPFNDFSNLLTTNEVVNGALSAGRTYSTEAVSAVQAELAGYPSQTGSLLGGTLGTNFTAQGQQQAQQGGSQISFPNVGPFLPAVDGAQPVAGNRFVLSPEAQASLPAPERNEGYSTVSLFGPQQVQSTAPPPALGVPVNAPAPAMAMVTSPPPVSQPPAQTSADTLMTAAQGQVVAPPVAPVAPAVDPSQFNANTLLGGINPNELLQANTAASDLPSGGLSSNEGIRAFTQNAMKVGYDTLGEYMAYVDKYKNWVKPANGSAAQGVAATGASGAATTGGAANPQLAAQMSQMMQVLAQLIASYAQRNGGKDSPELQQILQMAQQFQQLSSMGGSVGAQATQAASMANAVVSNAGGVAGSAGGSDVSGANKAMLNATQGQSFGINGCVRLVKAALNAAGVNTSGMSDHISSIDQKLSTGEMQMVASKQQLQSGQLQNLKPGDIAYSYGHVGVVGVQNGQMVVIHNSSSSGNTGQAIPIGQWAQLFPDRTAIVRYSPQALAQRTGQARSV